MAGINVQAHYDVQIRRQVCHEYFVLGWNQAQIAIHHDQHPSETTVGRIVDSYVAECNNVVVPPGSRGRLHSDRKFDNHAWGQLIGIVQDDEQFYLHGE